MASAKSICSLFVERAVGPVSMKRFASSLVGRKRDHRKRVAYIGCSQHEVCHDGQMIWSRALTRAWRWA